MQKKVRGTETEDGEEGGWRTEMQEREKGRGGERDRRCGCKEEQREIVARRH